MVSWRFSLLRVVHGASSGGSAFGPLLFLSLFPSFSSSLLSPSYSPCPPSLHIFLHSVCSIQTSFSSSPLSPPHPFLPTLHPLFFSFLFSPRFLSRALSSFPPSPSPPPASRQPQTLPAIDVPRVYSLVLLREPPTRKCLMVIIFGVRSAKYVCV